MWSHTQIKVQTPTDTFVEYIPPDASPVYIAAPCCANDKKKNLLKQNKTAQTDRDSKKTNNKTKQNHQIQSRHV